MQSPEKRDSSRPNALDSVKVFFVPLRLASVSVLLHVEFGLGFRTKADLAGIRCFSDPLDLINVASPVRSGKN